MASDRTSGDDTDRAAGTSARLRKTSRNRRSSTAGLTTLADQPSSSDAAVMSSTTQEDDRGRGHSRSRSEILTSVSPAPSRNAGSLRLHQARPSLEETRKGSGSAKQVRTARAGARLSPTERVYEDPEAAKSAFEAERAGNPRHRRAPTPYTSRARRRASQTGSSGAESVSGSGTEVDDRTIHRHGSKRSLRSKVSFDGRSRTPGGSRSRSRSRGGAHGDGGSGSGSNDDSDGGTHRPQSVLGAWDPGFGASQGIGPAGEAIEVIGLGRKTPRHRIFRREMLKPALRSAMSSRVDVASTASPSIGHTGLAEIARGLGGWDKPLPGRPGSIVSSVIDVLRSRPSLPPDKVLRQRSLRRGLFEIQPSGGTGASHSIEGLSTASPEFSHVRSRSFRAPVDAWSPSPLSDLPISPHPPAHPGRGHPPRPSLRALFASFSRGLNLDDPPLRALSRPRRPKSPVLLAAPAENLYAYLASVYLAEWREWPAAGGRNGGGSGMWMQPNSGGRDNNLGWEWYRRLEAAEGNRGVRGLMSWYAAEKYWDRGIIDWCQQNVPSEPIDSANQWGKKIFALPSTGFDTVEFFDESAQQAGDNGLLSWVTGSLLQTATSTLHMLRHSAVPFAFHLIPAPPPPYYQPPPHAARSAPSRPRNGKQRPPHALWEGFGTLVSVHKDDPSDRSMIIKVRPPSVVSGATMREFARTRREWRSLSVFQGEVGQADLLQSQVYDACVQNQVYSFAVTNLKYWVFGSFDSTYSRAIVSPVIDRKAREPSVMQCLTTWLIRSVDERPRASLAYSAQPSAIPSPTQALGSAYTQVDVTPPYSSPTRPSHSRQPSREQSREHSRSNSRQVTPTPHPDHSGYAPSPTAWRQPSHRQAAWTGMGQHPVQHGYSPYPSPGLSEFGYPAYDMHGAAGNAYGAYGAAGYGQTHGHGYDTWSPRGGGMGQYPQMGGMWYGSTGWSGAA